LCEGPFDAMAIKRNVIPLLGKNIQPTLMKKIVKSSVEKIYIALDKDAQKQALSFCEQLMKEGKEVYLDFPQEIESVNEAEYKGKDVELNKPKRGGSKKYIVYVKSDSGNVKKIFLKRF
jgi:chaperonin GroEL (HSP60 family)